MAKQKRTAQSETRPKFDQGLIEEVLEFAGGALYALTTESKNGRNIMTYSTMSYDWHILYDARYNDTATQWEKTVAMWKRMQEQNGLSTRRPKLTQKVWDKLEAQWKKDQANARRRAAAYEKKMKPIWEKEKAEAEKRAKEEAEKWRKDREDRAKEIEKLEQEEAKKLADAEKKKARKTKTKSKPKSKPKTTKSKATIRTKSAGKRTKWRDMKAKMEESATLDQFM